MAHKMSATIPFQLLIYCCLIVGGGLQSIRAQQQQQQSPPPPNNIQNQTNINNPSSSNATNPAPKLDPKPINGSSLASPDSQVTTTIQPTIQPLEVTTMTPAIANSTLGTSSNSSSSGTSSPPVAPRNDVNLAVIDYDAKFINDTLQFVNQNVSLNRHHNYAEMVQFLEELHHRYPNVTRLYSIGESVEKRKLWVLEMTENPGVHELRKPEFRYIANMHGNEVVGRELLLNFARLILENYHAEDPTDRTVSTGHKFARKLLNTTRIHLLPSLNPDGYEVSDVGCKYADNSRRGRLNANNFDLNRNFPDSLKRDPVTASTQPEVLAFMNWSHSEPFVLSANLHGGAEVVVYPYDGAYNASVRNETRLTPDDDIFRQLAQSYSFMHPHMHLGLACYDNCTDYHRETFPNGTTNGAAWYSIPGSLQDWIYDNTNEMDLTIEVGCNQYPPADTLESYWGMNKVSLFNFLLQVHGGIKGVVTDSITGEKLANVTVHVVDRPNSNHNITSSKYGDYFRLLAPGEYEVTFEKPGYQSDVASIILSPNSNALIQDIKLEPLSGGSHTPNHHSEAQSSAINHDGPKDGDDTSGGGDHSIVVATLVMSIITVLILLLMAGAYVIQRRRLTRSQSMCVELQPRTSTGISLGGQPPRSGSSSNTHLAA